jgi:hypothetical protein
MFSHGDCSAAVEQVAAAFADHLSLGDHKLLLNGHVGRWWRSVTPTCAKTVRGILGLSHHLKFMRFSLATYSQACLQQPQEEYAKRKLIASI